MTLGQSLVSDLEQEVAHARALFAAIPAEHLGWRPRDGAPSLGELAGRIADAPSWVGAMLQDELDADAPEPWAPFVPRERAELLDALDRNARLFASALKHRDDAQLRAAWRLVSGEEVQRSMPKHAAVRQACLHRAIELRGELAAHLRLLGVELPRRGLLGSD